MDFSLSAYMFGKVSHVPEASIFRLLVEAKSLVEASPDDVPSYMPFRQLLEACMYEHVSEFCRSLRHVRGYLDEFQFVDQPFRLGSEANLLFDTGDFASAASYAERACAEFSSDSLGHLTWLAATAFDAHLRLRNKDMCLEWIQVMDREMTSHDCDGCQEIYLERRIRFDLACGLHISSDLRENLKICLLYTSPSPRDRQKSRMPSSA